MLDLSRILAAPYCTMLLGDLGADVVKVERPGSGDDTRGWGPPFQGGESAYFLSVNRNKRSLTLDLKHPEGREVAVRLASKSDVLVHNFRPGVAERLGLGPEPLCQENTRLVYCRVSSFGQSGPYAERPGYDALIQAMGGLMSITGEPDGPPTKVGVAIVDVLAGLFAANGILAALSERERSGRGQVVDVALLDSLLAALVNQAQSYLTTGVAPGRLGSAHPSIVPYQSFRAADDWFFVAVGNDSLFDKLCNVLGHGELAKDERFRTNELRVKNRGALVTLLDGEFAQAKASEWVQRCRDHGVPAGPINDIHRVLTDPHLQQRGVVRKVEHETLGALELVKSPLELSRTPTHIHRAPPLLGQHSEQVLEELGLPRQRIRELVERGVV